MVILYTYEIKFYIGGEKNLYDEFLHPILKEKTFFCLKSSSNCQSLIEIFTADNALESQPPRHDNTQLETN